MGGCGWPNRTRARPRSSSSAPAGNPKNRFVNEAPRDDRDVGPVLWNVVVCIIEGCGGEASQHVQKNIQGGGTKLM